MTETRSIYCVACRTNVLARLTDGAEIYPHRADLAATPFWRCAACGNYVGCHHKTDNPTQPLGVIPTPELRAARGHLHALIDPVWRSGRTSRSKLYGAIAVMMGLRAFHTADLRSIEDARNAYRAAQEVIAGLPRVARGQG